jgi:hypothetical protein
VASPPRQVASVDVLLFLISMFSIESKITTNFIRSKMKEYFAAVCPQLREQLHVKGPNAHHFVQTTVIIIRLMLEKYPQHTLHYLINPLLHPFQPFLEFQKYKNNTFTSQKTFSSTTQNDDLLLQSIKYFHKSDDTQGNNIEFSTSIHVDLDMLSSCLEDLHTICTNYSNPLVFDTITSGTTFRFESFSLSTVLTNNLLGLWCSHSCSL